MIVVTNAPSCTETYVYYKMISGNFANNDETILDSSGNSNNAVNGDSVSDDVSDCSASADGLFFSGSCHALFSGVSPSSNGFSLDVYLKLQDGSSSTEMSVVEVLAGSAFKISVTPSSGTVTVYIDSQSASVSTCSGLQSKLE